MNVPDSFTCPVEVTLELISGKWKPLIIWKLSQQTLRFGELERLAPNATRKMITQQLRDLEKAGIIDRVVYAQVPPKVEYSLTDIGKSLLPVMSAMCNWGGSYLNLFTEKNNVGNSTTLL